MIISSLQGAAEHFTELSATLNEFKDAVMDTLLDLGQYTRRAYHLLGQRKL